MTGQRGGRGQGPVAGDPAPPRPGLLTHLSPALHQALDGIQKTLAEDT